MSLFLQDILIEITLLRMPKLAYIYIDINLCKSHFMLQYNISLSLVQQCMQNNLRSAGPNAVRGVRRQSSHAG